MDPILLATAITTLLTPFIKKIGDKALDKLAQQVPEVISKIWETISSRATSASDAAVDLARSPDDTENEVFFKKQLQKALEKDAVLASELTKLLERAKTESRISAVGNGVVANNNSVSVGKISIGGNVSGGVVVGNDKQASNKPKLTHLDNNQE